MVDFDKIQTQCTEWDNYPNLNLKQLIEDAKRDGVIDIDELLALEEKIKEDERLISSKNEIELIELKKSLKKDLSFLSRNIITKGINITPFNHDRIFEYLEWKWYSFSEEVKNKHGEFAIVLLEDDDKIIILEDEFLSFDNGGVEYLGELDNEEEGMEYFHEDVWANLEDEDRQMLLEAWIGKEEYNENLFLKKKLGYSYEEDKCSWNKRECFISKLIELKGIWLDYHFFEQLGSSGDEIQKNFEFFVNQASSKDFEKWEILVWKLYILWTDFRYLTSIKSELETLGENFNLNLSDIFIISRDKLLVPPLIIELLLSTEKKAFQVWNAFFLKFRKYKISFKDWLYRLVDIKILFFHSRNIWPNSTKPLSSFFTSETTRNLNSSFYHSQVSFS